MKLLLDENLPKRLKEDLVNHDVSTVADEGWRAVKNGELLRLMIASGFDALITRDRRLRYQQNFDKYPIPVIILKAGNGEYRSLRQLVPQINSLLRRRLNPGSHEISLLSN
jgi:predicted nuclease of predicted toxin-antitoxin system